MAYSKTNFLRSAPMVSVASVGLASPAFTHSAQAQATQPLVDICTGLSLPQSAVTDIVGAVNQAVVEEIEDVFDVLNALPLISFVVPNISVSDIIDDVTDGTPIGVQVLDTDGNLVNSSDCNVTAESFTLNQEGGIEIGGNRISGLGQDGLTASAAEVDAIALGNNASTGAGATGAVAIGTGASVTVANSVALGAESVADRGAQTGYSAPGLSGTFDSVGTVSVGASGALRQITNVAPGTEASDAATVGQVQGALDAIDAVDAVAANSVQYDSPAQTSVTLAGAGGTTISNLSDGDVSGGSSEAVNGSQLFATNQQLGQHSAAIQANADAIAALDDGSSGSALAVLYDDDTRTSLTLDGAGGTSISNVADGEVSAASSDAVNGAQLFATNQMVGTNGDAIDGLDARVTTNEDDIANLDGRVTENEGDIAGLDTRVTDNSTTIGSVDARVTVNEGDILNIDNRVADNTTNIANIDLRVTTSQSDIESIEMTVVAIDGRVSDHDMAITNVQAQLAIVPMAYVQDDNAAMPADAPTNLVAVMGAGGNAARLTNLSAGNVSASSTDAVNGAQLAATNDAVATNRTDIDQNTADIATLNSNVMGSTVVAVQYSNPDTPTQSNGGTITNDVTLVGADTVTPVGLHNVAAGTASTDAVNLGQLQSGLSSVMADSVAYTDQRFNTMSARVDGLAFDLNQVRQDAFAGTAGALAVAGIPQTMDAGRSMVGGAIGHYRGETAFALGMSTVIGDGDGVIKAGATMDTRGKGGFSAGAGFSF